MYVNAGTIGAEVHLPFGGTKDTGNGHREAGQAALDFFTEWKSIYVDYSGKLQGRRSTPPSSAPKIAVVGTSGSGKTTVARRLAEHHGVPHVELDALRWGRNWSEPTAEEFRARVERETSSPGWVAEQELHGKLGDSLLRRADFVVWLDRRQDSRAADLAEDSAEDPPEGGALGRQPGDLARCVLQPRLALRLDRDDPPRSPPPVSRAPGPVRVRAPSLPA